MAIAGMEALVALYGVSQGAHAINAAAARVISRPTWADVLVLDFRHQSRLRWAHRLTEVPQVKRLADRSYALIGLTDQEIREAIGSGPTPTDASVAGSQSGCARWQGFAPLCRRSSGRARRPVTSTAIASHSQPKPPRLATACAASLRSASARVSPSIFTVGAGLSDKTLDYAIGDNIEQPTR